MSYKTLYQRVCEESVTYDSHFEAALDHLKMAHAQLFEEFEGRNCENILSDIKLLSDKIESLTK